MAGKTMRGAVKPLLTKLWKGVKMSPPLDRIRRLHQDRLLSEWYPEIYGRHVSKTVDERKVIIVENALQGMNSSFRLLYEDMKADGRFRIHIHHIGWNLTDRDDFEVRGARLLKDAADARYIFLSEACLPLSCVKLREETTLVQLWHGCGAFKRFGRSTALMRFGPDLAHFDRHPQYENYSLVTVSAPEVVWAYEEAMGLEGRKGVVVPTGVSRTDVFFDKEYLEEARERVLRKVPQTQGKKVILYAPTFRGAVAVAGTPDYSRFDLMRLKEALGEDTVLLVKHHPIVKDSRIPKIPEELRDTFAVDVTKSLSIEEAMIAADAVITDYSSLIFEYSLLEKPLVFYPYDLEEYFDWRGFYYDFDELTPGPVCPDVDALLAALALPRYGYDPERMKAFRERFMAGCDGHSTQRIEELVFGRPLEGKA